jgi:hypothetical protein
MRKLCGVIAQVRPCTDREGWRTTSAMRCDAMRCDAMRCGVAADRDNQPHFLSARFFHRLCVAQWSPIVPRRIPEPTAGGSGAQTGTGARRQRPQRRHARTRAPSSCESGGATTAGRPSASVFTSCVRPSMAKALTSLSSRGDTSERATNSKGWGARLPAWAHACVCVCAHVVTSTHAGA